MMNMKEIVLEAGHSTVPAYWLSDEKPIACSTSNFEKLVAFTEALVAELAKQNEPVMVLFQHEDTGRTTSIEPQSASDFGRINKRWINCGPLFSLPPTAEQIANETAEACARFCDYKHNQPVELLEVAKTQSECAEAIRSGAWKEFKK